MALDTTILVKLAGTETGSFGFSTLSAPFTREYAMALANGTGTNQADRIFHAQRQINASSNDDLDLAGVLSSAFGTTITFVKIKAILIAAASGNTNDVVVGNAAANAFVGPFGAATHTVALKPGEVFFVSNRGAGWTVTAGTGDVLRIANSGGGTPVTYDIMLVGTSA